MKNCEANLIFIKLTWKLDDVVSFSPNVYWVIRLNNLYRGKFPLHGARITLSKIQCIPMNRVIANIAVMAIMRNSTPRKISR